ncbi:MAG: hypothetical protein KF861_11720 [Planctomycetaceae bacterium]|nr:hypothetical protein [Planctomycetaceae bacterium]
MSEIHAHQPVRWTASCVFFGAAWFCVNNASLLAQAAAGIWWAAPPPAVWTPQPVVVQFVPVQQALRIVADDPGLTEDPSAWGAARDASPAGQLQLTVMESFLSRLFAREITDSGPIRDCLAGANVYGDQFTVTRLSVDCQPCASNARILMRLNGTVIDHTVGVTRPATVRTEGNHSFEMTKQVDFDGRQFTTRTPAAWVTPQIAYRGASTVVSGVPVLGSIGSAIALNEAERRRPAAVQFALQRVTRTAAPRFNREVDEKLALANQRLGHYVPIAMDAMGLTSDDQSVSTSDDRLMYTLRTPAAGPERLSGQPTSFDGGGPVFLDIIEDDGINATRAPVLPPAGRASPAPQIKVAPPVRGRAATVLVHESLVNHVLARLPLNGREVPDRMIDRLLQALQDGLAGRGLTGVAQDLNESSAEFATLVLDPERAASIRFDAGSAVVTLRAGFRPVVGGELPTQNVELRYRLALDEQSLRLEPEGIEISSLRPEDDGPLVGLARPVIRQQIQQRLQPIEVPRRIPLQLGELMPTTLFVRDVVFTDGWLAIAID